MLTVRPATPDDCEAVADIYRYYVENSTATFDLEAPSVAQWRTRLETTVAAGRPFLVAGAPGEVVGYACLGVYRGKAGWSWTAEDSIYLRPEAAGRGTGKHLLRALINAADPAVTRTIMAVVSEDVPESIALHTKVGFVEVGRTPGVGRKFDLWIGCVYLQYTIGP